LEPAQIHRQGKSAEAVVIICCHWMQSYSLYQQCQTNRVSP